jgi:hypothetical protein
MTPSRSKILKIFLGITPPAIGVILVSTYFWIADKFPEYALGLFANKNDIVTTVLGFSFSMLGFLAALITLLFGFSDKEAYKKFNRNGGMGLLLFLYNVTIVCLVITAFLALFGYSNNKIFVLPFRMMIGSFVVNIIQVFILTFVISNFSKNASE